ncbi:MAG: 16S rRNA (guanine(966)-N(2))-methyltransferase RsmD [Ignavibacteriae bacterium]|nr:16S rRNA (guanine(966)-N(2))-methyltransferase RsmD [Ignavibacteria bacterium]MBI3365067.1 16S rRNA (guanine(966)-N(2))-methyltransferase RsmD [Ignavibacteriota bacterium]
MRIITGKYRGRTLRTAKEIDVRPAMDRVKGAIFNMLQNRLGLGGARVLDLFAGIGSLGFEAVSRGAALVVFIDDNRRMLDVIEENAGILGCRDECEIIQDDAFSFIDRTLDESFDLIFADPPYAYERTSEIPRKIFDRQLLKKNGFLIIEHARRTAFDPSSLYTLKVQKDFGNTRLSFFVHPA